MEKKTPMYDCHIAAGGKPVPFAGYLLPIQYTTGIIAEHMAVRKQAGLFDVSHMGEVIYTGKDAVKNLNRLLTNDVALLHYGEICYSPMCNEEGGFVDDLIAYKMGDEKYMLVVNASNHEKDVAWMKAHLFGDVKFQDISDATAEIALQGPNSPAILAKLTDAASLPVENYTFKENVLLDGISCLVSVTGYTGEMGYEIYLDNAHAVEIWNSLLAAGKDLGLIPCALGCRDTLRLEAGMPLYGHEMDDSITPLEIGLGYFVHLEKEGGFLGKEAMIAKKPYANKRVGLKVIGRGIVREHEKIFVGTEEIGVTTSGTYCPYFGCGLAMARINKKYGKIGTQVEVEVRGRRIAAEVVALPFYKRV